MKLIMVRHTSVDVTPGTCYGQSDVGLRESFPVEAAAVASRIARYAPDRIYTSPLSRCVRLAEHCGYSSALRDARLMEINFGEWEMKRFDEITDPRINEWYDDFFNVRATGGESFADQQARVADFLDDLRDSGCRCVIVFAHGGTILQAMMLQGQATKENAFDMQPPYGGVIEMDI